MARGRKKTPTVLKEMMGIKIFGTVYKDKKGAYFYRKHRTFLPISQGTLYTSQMGQNAIKNGGKLCCLDGIECVVNIVLINEFI